MVREAEENKAADEKRKSDIEVKNKAQTYIDEINRVLTEQGDKLDAAQKEQMTKIRDEAQGAIQTDDIEKLREIVGRLEDAANMAAQQQAQGGNAQYTNPNQGGSNGGEAPKDGDDVVDADFTDVK